MPNYTDFCCDPWPYKAGNFHTEVFHTWRYLETSDFLALCIKTSRILIWIKSRYLDSMQYKYVLKVDQNCLSNEIHIYKFTIHLSLLKVVWKFRKHSNYKATHSSYTRHTLGIVLYICLVYYFTVLYISINYRFLVLLFFSLLW